ncbi:MAG: tRNA pseudouridine(55) synthase TruB [Pseudomonadota bacterium]
MARRRKGRDISGWIVIDKPAGPSSNAVVGRVRHAFDAKKAGHAGTLDPAATGILAVALGEATKTVPYVTDAEKNYLFTVRWGAATNTDDAEGEVIETSATRPSPEAIAAALPAFTGDILQVPPAYSAVKIDGERAYARARAGEDVALAARPLHVARIALVEVPDPDHAVLEMACGKGGYVRAIARDLGRALGCLGHVRELRRTASGPFDLDDAIAFDSLDTATDDMLIPLETALESLPEARCNDLAAARLRNGNPAPVISTTAGYGDEAWASCAGRAVAVGYYRAGELHPKRVFAP